MRRAAHPIIGQDVQLVGVSIMHGMLSLWHISMIVSLIAVHLHMSHSDIKALWHQLTHKLMRNVRGVMISFACVLGSISFASYISWSDARLVTAC